MLRAPAEPLIEAPEEWIARSAGPDFRRIPVPADGADLLGRHAGEPIGERVVVTGQVPGWDGRPVPGTLVEMWQASAAGIYEDPSDPGFFPHDPDFIGAGAACGMPMAGSASARSGRARTYPAWLRARTGAAARRPVAGAVRERDRLRPRPAQAGPAPSGPGPPRPAWRRTASRRRCPCPPEPARGQRHRQAVPGGFPAGQLRFLALARPGPGARGHRRAGRRRRRGRARCSRARPAARPARR